MNKIVKEHYPISKLPEDLRAGLNPDAEVTVTVEQEEKPEKVMTLEEIFSARRTVFNSPEEVVQHVRSLRDEWK
jgi:hypothetical protein